MPPTKRSVYKVLGTRPIRHDGLDKVTGRAIYGADVTAPGMVWGELLRSPHAHAEIVSINYRNALEMPGVLGVITHADFPRHDSEEMRRGATHIMADEKVLFKGHPVAAVAATSRNIAIEAMKHIQVEYKILPAVMNVADSMKPDAPLLHPTLECDHFGEIVIGSNIASHIAEGIGDIDAGFAKSDLVVELTTTSQMVHQGYVEPHNATALWDESGRLTISSSTQGMFGIRTQVAAMLAVPESRVRVNAVEIGGGFGGKTLSYLPTVAALLSRAVHRPVKMVMDRPAVFEGTGPASGSEVTAKIGVTNDGKLISAHVEMTLEAGAYPGSAIIWAVPSSFAAYDIPNARADGYDVLVNRPKTNAYRAPGLPQVAFAVEQAIDEICDRMSWDKIDFRIKNSSREGTQRVNGPRFGRIGFVETLEAARSTDHWASPKPVSDNRWMRGRGLGVGYAPHSGGLASAALALNKDGTVSLTEGSQDIGGTRASVSMQVAEVLGIDAHSVIPVIPDTDGIGYTDVTAGSRVTNVMGVAAYLAANELVEKLKARAAVVLDSESDAVEFEDGVFSVTGQSANSIPFVELAGRMDETGGPVTSTGSIDHQGDTNGYGVHICDIEIDRETGKTNVIRYTALQDVGQAAHPSYAEGQVQGGAVQGIGWALNEEYVYDADGRMENPSFLDYRMPISMDLPMIEAILVEVPNPLHPFGIRGAAEVPIVPPLGAVPNAIADATGHRFLEAPIKPSVILRWLLEDKPE
ncbi:MAG: xanthine dehydrogenase family protein molybdopterin-binding subunit [Chloroflexi bacterium]|nr:xanthine dehydrogenase family protein molybdopterin-binding subunit [Chloroflexota bacterium]